MNIHSLVLTEDQSAFVRECGKHFIVLTPGSYPRSQGQVVLHIVECGDRAAADACSVALGNARAVKISNSPPIPQPSNPAAS